MISDYGRQRIWPDQEFYRYPNQPTYIPNPQEEAEKIKKFKELLDKAAEMDKKAGQPNCEAPEKIEFIESLELRLLELEKQLKELKAAGKTLKKGKAPKKVIKKKK